MRIERAANADEINYILNHPEVRPDVLSDQTATIDLTEAAKNQQNVFLVGDGQIVLCFRIIEGLYEFHVAALPERRGRQIIEFSRLAEIEMFCGTDCVELLTRIPVNHTASEGLAKLRHFKPRWERPDVVFRGNHVAFRVWSKTMQEWLEEYDIEHVIEAMKDRGQISKARAWQARWAILSREPLMRLDS